MEEESLKSLKKELKLKRFQFDSLYEFSSTIYSSFRLDSILRVFFSSLMGQLAISRIFFLDRRYGLLRKKGFRLTDKERNYLLENLKLKKKNWFYIDVENLGDDCSEVRELLLKNRIYTLINLDESGRNVILLGLGKKLNRTKLSAEAIEFTFFLGRFMLIAMENSFMVEKMIENEKLEREIEIAKEIQLSLLPEKETELKNFELAVTYEPMNSVGGDYYDILPENRNKIPILIADVEGKGLPAALLAASSQAVFHSLNETYSGNPGGFMTKANSLIYKFTGGNRFITVFFMTVDQTKREISYVNAGHVEPILINGEKIKLLSSTGFLTGFIRNTEYGSGTFSMKRGDLLAVFTDGVPEIENKRGEEFGRDRISEYLIKNRKKSAAKINQGLFKTISKFSEGKKPHDDCTFILLKSI